MKYLLLLALSFPAFAQINEIYLYPQFVHEPLDHMVVQNGRVTRNPYVNHLPQLFVRHMGEDAIDGNVSYDVGQYSGLHIDEDYQFGELDVGSPAGTSAAQMMGYGVGCMINTWQFDYKLVQGGGPNCTYQYSWDASLPTAPRPWTQDGQLVLQMLHKIPQYHKRGGKNKAIGQSSFGVILQHPNGHLIVFVINLFDPRGVYRENKAHDTYSTYVSSPLVDSSKFITKSKHSRSFSSKPFKDERFFRVHITKENLQAVIDKVGAPGEPSDYILRDAIWLLEIAGYGNGSNASLGASIRDFMVLNCGEDC